MRIRITLKRTELAPNSCAAWLKASEIALKLNKVTEAKDFQIFKSLSQLVDDGSGHRQDIQAARTR